MPTGDRQHLAECGHWYIGILPVLRIRPGYEPNVRSWPKAASIILDFGGIYRPLYTR